MYFSFETKPEEFEAINRTVTIRLTDGNISIYSSKGTWLTLNDEAISRDKLKVVKINGRSNKSNGKKGQKGHGGHGNSDQGDAASLIWRIRKLYTV